jgi:hypothetical protein
VCAICNNGWMSRLEAESIDALASVVCEQELELISLRRQRQIALWATKTAMMVDLTQSEPVLTSAQLRRMRTNHAIPGGTRVWMGSCGQMDPLVTTHTVRIEIETVGQSAHRPTGLYCPMKIGHLCLYVYFPAVDAVIRHPAAHYLRIARIWPRRGSSLPFPPPVRPADGPSFEYFADRLWRDLALFTPAEADIHGISEL